MSLTTGSRLGPYEILAAIGAGGMGEVYRARDTKLGRDVALKVLPAEFALDPERVARFTREAQMLASLNHQNIAAIYGFEENALVLEFVDGPTLADRIAHGPIPLDEALPIARQIGEALEAAHEQGIIHRDLKPANIKVRPDGTVKVLDFGLAKLLGPDGPPKGGHYADRSVRLQPDLTASPTITTPAMTMAGVILGTAAYMSPEQAKGRPADKRSDIWAFGCVLFEMLTGKRAFDGDDVSDTLAVVLRGEPEWSALPNGTPERIDTLLRRCLRRDAQKRLPQIAMARFEIDETSTEPPAPSPTTAGVVRKSFVLWAIPVAIVLASAVTSGVWWLSGPQSSPPIITRFAIPLAEGEQAATYPFRTVAISPDGSQIVYVANGRLNLRSMSDPSPRVLSGADTGGIGAPAFSPDGQFIVYGQEPVRGEQNAGIFVRKIAIGGGLPQTIAQVRQFGVGGLDWSADRILYDDPTAGVTSVSPDGGKPEVIVSLAKGELIEGPSMLPGGGAVLFALATDREPTMAPTAELWDAAKIVVQALPSGERTTLIEGGSDPHYLPTGHVLFARGGMMFAVPFDLKRLQVTGKPVPVIEGVARSAVGRAATGAAQFAVSASGSAIYVPGPAKSLAQPKVVVMDRDGKIDALKLPIGFYERPRVSPDGRRVAFGSDDATSAIIWIYDLSGQTSMRQLTFEGRNRFPIWSPDGAKVAFQSDREGDSAIYWQRSDGSAKAERVTKPDEGETHVPESWSRDGRHLLYSVSKGALNSLAVYSVDSKTSKPFGNVQSQRLLSPSFSSDGRWVAYTVTTRGLNQVFVQPFPDTGARYLAGNGARPQWSPDGKELYFFRPDGTFVVTVTTQPTFTVSNPVALPFNVYAGRGPGFGRDVDIMPDGKRFVAVLASTEAGAGAGAVRNIQVILNWFEELKQRVPVK